jgi:hypothetical protein
MTDDLDELRAHLVDDGTLAAREKPISPALARYMERLTQWWTPDLLTGILEAARSAADARGGRMVTRVDWDAGLEHLATFESEGSANDDE